MVCVYVWVFVYVCVCMHTCLCVWSDMLFADVTDWLEINIWSYNVNWSDLDFETWITKAMLLCPESPACHYDLVFPHHSCPQTRMSESGRWSSSRMQRRMCWWPQMWHPKVWTFPTFSMSLTTTCLKTLRTTVSEGGFVTRLAPFPNWVTVHREKFEEIQILTSWTIHGLAFTILELIGNLELLLPKIPCVVIPGLQFVIDIGFVTQLWLPALGHGLVSQKGFCLLSWASQLNMEEMWAFLFGLSSEEILWALYFFVFL